MRVTRGYMTETMWDGRLLRYRGWWAGVRHNCWRGRVFVEGLMRAVFIREHSLVHPTVRSRRYAVLTETCRHCRQTFALQADRPEIDAMRQEVATLRRLGFRSAQQVGSSPDAWPQWAVSGFPQVNRVR